MAGIHQKTSVNGFLFGMPLFQKIILPLAFFKINFPPQKRKTNGTITLSQMTLTGERNDPFGLFSIFLLRDLCHPLHFSLLRSKIDCECERQQQEKNGSGYCFTKPGDHRFTDGLLKPFHNANNAPIAPLYSPCSTNNGFFSFKAV